MNPNNVILRSIFNPFFIVSINTNEILPYEIRKIESK